MKCSDVKKVLYEYASGRCADVLSARIKEHCAGCPSCRRELAAIRSYQKTMSSLPREKALRNFNERVFARCAGKEKQPLKIYYYAVIPAAAVFAGVIISASLFFHQDTKTSPSPVAVLVEKNSTPHAGAHPVLRRDSPAEKETASSGLLTMREDKSAPAEVQAEAVVPPAQRSEKMYFLVLSIPRQDSAGDREKKEISGMYSGSARSDMKKSAKPDVPSETRTEPADQIISIITQSGGRVITQDVRNGACVSITADIPSSSFGSFQDRLSRTGTILKIETPSDAGGAIR
ncbi:MAG: zf-HC2 domain-containing protein, partial [Spirochaetota bacterium]